jgi:hypothetical protein
MAPAVPTKPLAKLTVAELKAFLKERELSEAVRTAAASAPRHARGGRGAGGGGGGGGGTHACASARRALGRSSPSHVVVDVGM